MRREAILTIGRCLIISIHAPREGCDRLIISLPVCSNFISIHAPREGCDSRVTVSPGRREGFQSTHPARGATCVVVPAGYPAQISIHAPREGCDAASTSAAKQALISIHAPREGCDSGIIAAPPSGGDFNPRTPRGVRHGRPALHPHLQHFNPRTPRGVRRILEVYTARGGGISIHAPREGCDRARVRTRAHSILFQSTHPARGATGHERRRFGEMAYFNPRTPRGVRPPSGCSTSRCCSFQSTHPARGATFEDVFQDVELTISIHAPREGCDGHAALG